MSNACARPWLLTHMYMYVYVNQESREVSRALRLKVGLDLGKERENCSLIVL